MHRQLKATVCYVDYGESKLNIKDALAVIEGWERGFYLCVFRNDPNAQNSLVTDWPVSEDGQAYAYIAPNRLISEVNGSLSVYLDEDLNDPLAKDASAFYNFSIRTENSEDAPVYNGEIALPTAVYLQKKKSLTRQQTSGDEERDSDSGAECSCCAFRTIPQSNRWTDQNPCICRRYPAFTGHALCSVAVCAQTSSRIFPRRISCR